MRVVKMEYNPYKMKTSICIDGSDVKGNSNYPESAIWSRRHKSITYNV